MAQSERAQEQVVALVEFWKAQGVHSMAVAHALLSVATETLRADLGATAAIEFVAEISATLGQQIRRAGDDLGSKSASRTAAKPAFPKQAIYKN